MPNSPIPLLGLLLAACGGSSTFAGDDAGSSPADTALLVDGSSPADTALLVDGSASGDASHPTVDLAQPSYDFGSPADRQTEIMKSKTSAPNGYYQYLPGNYDGKTATPLLVFWHGIGENGNGDSDLPKVLANGPPELISKNNWDNARPFVVLSPQHANDGGCPSSSEIDAFITWAKGHYAVDDKRIYLTGLSCGAIGSWAYIGQFKDKDVAATLLLSGNPHNTVSADGCSLVSKLSIWSAHGDMDPTVPYQPDHDALQTLLACPQPRASVKFTDVVKGGHNIWDPIYDLSGGYGDVYAWMLANAKP